MSFCCIAKASYPINMMSQPLVRPELSLHGLYHGLYLAPVFVSSSTSYHHLLITLKSTPKVPQQSPNSALRNIPTVMEAQQCLHVNFIVDDYLRLVEKRERCERGPTTPYPRSMSLPSESKLYTARMPTDPGNSDQTPPTTPTEGSRSNPSIDCKITTDSLPNAKYQLPLQTSILTEDTNITTFFDRDITESPIFFSMSPSICSEYYRSQDSYGRRQSSGGSQRREESAHSMKGSVGSDWTDEETDASIGYFESNYSLRQSRKVLKRRNGQSCLRKRKGGGRVISPIEGMKEACFRRS